MARHDYSPEIAKRQVISTRSALSATTSPCTTGRLLGTALDVFYATRNSLVYAVLSYDTPIAWVSETPDQVTWYIVADHFSPTTSRHQSQVIAALQNLPTSEKVVFL